MNSLSTILVILAVLSGTALADGQDAPRVSEIPGALLDDVGATPTRENGLLLLGGTLAAIVVYQFEDADGISRALNQPVIDDLADFGNVWGDVRVQAPLALGAWGAGAWAGDERLARTGFDLTRGLLLTYTTVSLTKVAVNRTRPNGEDYSFPSGHTAAAFTTAGVVTRRYGGWAGGVSVGLGVLTALGRMEDMKHYASDVIAGATIGWIFGRTVARDDPEDRSAWRMIPLGGGLALARRF